MKKGLLSRPSFRVPALTGSIVETGLGSGSFTHSRGWYPLRKIKGQAGMKYLGFLT
jgi:hypothetical protein